MTSRFCLMFSELSGRQVEIKIHEKKWGEKDYCPKQCLVYLLTKGHIHYILVTHCLVVQLVSRV